MLPHHSSRVSFPAWLIGVVITATGCASSHALTTPVTTTPTTPMWTSQAAGVTVESPSAAATADLGHWWQQFGDATLTSLVDTALHASPDIRTAAARVEQARAERGLATAALKPAVNGNLGAAARRNNGESLSPTIDASWEIDLSGRLRQAIAASTADLQATTEDFHAVQVSLAADVAGSYLQVRTLQTRLAIARQNASTQEETVALTGFRAQAGLVSSLDVEQARATLEQTRAQIPVLESGIAQAIHRLGTLSGREPGALTSELGRPASLPVVPPSIVIDIPANALRQRPDIRAAESRIVAATARVAQASASRRPQFSLSGSFGSNLVTNALSVGLAGATSGASVVASLAGSFTQVIFDGGRIRQQVAIQSAAEEQAVATYEGSVLTALREVEDALVSFEQNRLRLASLQAAADAANAAALLASTQYAAGLTDFQNVLSTQRTALTVQDAFATTAGDRATAVVQLFKALGGGWTPMSTASPTTRSAS